MKRHMRLNEWWADAKTIAHRYGKRHQMYKLVEECSELSEAIMHYLDHEKKTRDDVADELADVAVLVPQVAYLLGIERKVIERIEFKYERQMKRMAEEKSSSDKNGDGNGMQ